MKTIKRSLSMKGNITFKSPFFKEKFMAEDHQEEG